ncbi:MAG: group II intron reverse transcriptase/maturase [Chitinivibrionales bacterium]
MRIANDGRKTGALINRTKGWQAIDWQKARREVRKLQMRIAKAVKDKKYNKVKSLQWILTHSFHAKALAVKRVTSNKGKHTPGVDGVLWMDAGVKTQALHSLRQHGYKAQPLRRVYIRKKSGKLRPLSIPTMFDRAMQALYKLALAPVAETTADRNSYGFRELRNCADANAAVFNALSKPNSAQWVWEADITGCFDTISREWILENIPMERRILRQWLDAGYVENGATFPTYKGTPQGGIVSPTIANMTLDGINQTVVSAVPRRMRVNFVRYADDFIVTGKSKRLLEQNIIPKVTEFLEKRGLTLSKEKSKVTHIKDGFTFLGQTFRKHGTTLHVTPAQEGVRSISLKVGTIIRDHINAPVEMLVKRLNQTLRGWANYHRHVVASEAFRRVDTCVYEHLWRRIHRKHPMKSKDWLVKKYWSAAGRKWTFSAKTNYKGKLRTYQVLRVSSIGIKRHIKIQADANPYLPEYANYFAYRRQLLKGKEEPLSTKIVKKQNEVKPPGCATGATLANA